MPRSEGRGEGLRVRDPGNDTAAPMRLVADLDTVDTSQSFSGVELSGVLQVPDPARVHLLGHPAFVPDVRMAAALVERCEYALHFGRAVACDGQPGALRVVLVEVSRGACDADLRQAGTARLETYESYVLLKVGGVLGAAARLDQLPGRPGVVAGGRLGAILAIRLLWTVANFGHVSVLPVNEGRRPQPLMKMRREMSSVMPGGPINEEYLAFVEDPVPSGVLNPPSRPHSPR